MVLATPGTLLSCDPTIKQFLLLLDKEHKFVLRDIDDSHLLIQKAAMDMIMVEIDKLHNENTYVSVADKDRQIG